MRPEKVGEAMEKWKWIKARSNLDITNANHRVKLIMAYKLLNTWFRFESCNTRINWHPLLPCYILPASGHLYRLFLLHDIFLQVLAWVPLALLSVLDLNVTMLGRFLHDLSKKSSTCHQSIPSHPSVPDMRAGAYLFIVCLSSGTEGLGLSRSLLCP